MDAGEAFAALGHQIGVTGAVHFRVHHSIWKAAVKEIGARSTKDTMDSFNIKRWHHKQTPADPADPCCCPSSFCRHRCSPHRGTLWARAKLRLQGQKDLGWNSPLCHLLVLWLRQSHSHPQSPHMLKRDVNTYSKAGYGRSGEMTSGSHQHSAGEIKTEPKLRLWLRHSGCYQDPGLQAPRGPVSWTWWPTAYTSLRSRSHFTSLKTWKLSSKLWHTVTRPALGPGCGGGR